MGWALAANDVTPRPGAEPYLAAALASARACPCPPLETLARLLAERKDTEGHFHAFVLLTDAAGCSLSAWWAQHEGDGAALVALVEEALFRAQLAG